MARKAGVEPTDKQLQLFAYLIAHIERHGYQPTRAEMAAHFGVTKNAISNMLKELDRRGLVDMPRGEKSKERAVHLNGVTFKAVAVEPVERPVERNGK